MIEDKVEQHLKKRVKELGGETRKVNWPGRRGAPDRLVMLTGQHLLVECKRPKGGVLAPWQVREHAKLRAAGFWVLVLSSIEEIDAWADAIALWEMPKHRGEAAAYSASQQGRSVRLVG